MNTFFLDCAGGSGRWRATVMHYDCCEDIDVTLSQAFCRTRLLFLMFALMFAFFFILLVQRRSSLRFSLRLLCPLHLLPFPLFSVRFPLSSEPLRSKTQFQSVDPHLKSIAISAAQDIKYMSARSDTCAQARLFAFRRLFVPLPVQNNQWDALWNKEDDALFMFWLF